MWRGYPLQMCQNLMFWSWKIFKMRVVILNPHPRRHFSPIYILFPKKWWHDCPIFFESTWDRWGHEKNYILSLAVPLQDILPPIWLQIPDLFAFWDIWGIFFQKVERQGKSTQNLCIEPNNLPPNFGTPSMTCWEETRVSKLKFPNITQIWRHFSSRTSL